MNLCTTTTRLFPSFPRDVGCPERTKCASIEKFEQWVTVQNGIKDVYVALYDNRPMIDKIFFDIDGKLGETFSVTKQFYQHLKEQHYSVIPICSGKKGFHLYLELEPFVPTDLEKAKKHLRSAALTLIYDCFGQIPEVFDMQVLGDIRRIARVPNTLRPPENINYCTYLPDLRNLTAISVLNLIKHPRPYTYPVENLVFPLLYHLAINNEAVPKTKNIANFETHDRISLWEGGPILEEYLGKYRYCLYHHLTTVAEPIHKVRVAAAGHLLYREHLSIDTVTNLFLKLKWADRNRDTTKYQLESIKPNIYPRSCEAFKSLGIVTPELCQRCASYKGIGK